VCGAPLRHVRLTPYSRRTTCKRGAPRAGCFRLELDWSAAAPTLHLHDNVPGFAVGEEFPGPQDLLSVSGRGLFLIGALGASLKIVRRPSGGLSQASSSRYIARRSPGPPRRSHRRGDDRSARSASANARHQPRQIIVGALRRGHSHRIRFEVRDAYCRVRRTRGHPAPR
jgi:hypothetical protein